MQRKQVTMAMVMILLLFVLSSCSPELKQPESRKDITTQEDTAQSDSENSTDEIHGDADVSAGGTGETAEEDASGENAAADPVPAIDFTLTDQYGNSHTLSDYKGRVVFLNFWATWCPPCRAEMPDIQKLYMEYEEAGDDSVVILGVAAPNLGSEKDIAGITSFLEENGYTYPVLMDETGDLFYQYVVSAYPTTYMIDKEGNVFGYLTGGMPESTMRSIIHQTVTGVRSGS